MATVAVNGTPQVFNNMQLQINGSPNIDIQGYVMSVDWDTGPLTEHVQTLNQNAKSVVVNPINSSPTATIRFAPGAFANFYAFLNDRFTSFTLNFSNYTTGDLAGSTQPLILTGCKIAQQSGGSRPQSPSNDGVVKIMATDIQWLV